MSAWGRDPEYWRLWGGLNTTLCMWLYRRVGLMPGYVSRGSRVTCLTREQFKKSLMGLSASPEYLDWIVGRQLRDTDRSPAYQRIKAIIVRRMAEDGVKAMLPQPAWAPGHNK